MCGIGSCTGYGLRFPFLLDALLEIKQNGVDLYKHVFHPDFPTLAFVGWCNVAGSAFPVAEIQGRWVARVLAGRMPLPSGEDMHAAIERYRTHPSHRSPVPMQVQLLEYVEDIASILSVRPLSGGIRTQHPGGSWGLFRQPITGLMNVQRSQGSEPIRAAGGKAHTAGKGSSLPLTMVWSLGSPPRGERSSKRGRQKTYVDEQPTREEPPLWVFLLRETSRPGRPTHRRARRCLYL